MEHLLFGGYLLCLSTGLLGLAALGFLRARSKVEGMGFILGVQAALLFGLAAAAADYYLAALGLRADPAGGANVGRSLSTIIAAISMAAMYGFAFAAFATLGGRGKFPRLRLAGRILAGTELACIAAAMAAKLAGGGIGAALSAFFSSPAWSLGSYTLIGLTLVCFAALLVRLASEEASKSLRLLYKAYAVVAAAFAALGPVEWLLDRAELQLPRPLSLDFLALLAWNLAAAAAAIVEFRKPASAAEGDLLPDIPREKADALGLTGREAQMALLIAKGLSNKEIGAALGISESTVRTHIYNLYRKVGARGRVELIALLRS